jgi:hypothetical protein
MRCPEKLLSLAVYVEIEEGLGPFHFLFPHFTFFLSEFQDFSMPWYVMAELDSISY